MRRNLLIAILILLLCAACGRSTPTPLPPEDILARATARMKSLSSFHFIIERTGAPVYVDAGGLLAFGRAEGDFSAPDRAQGSVRFSASGIVAALKFISIGDNYWQTNPLSGKWEEYPAGSFFNPATLFDAEIGLQPILETDLADLRLEGSEELEEMPGKLLYALTGRLRTDRIYQLSGGMMGPDTLNLRLWIDPATFDIHRLQLDGPSPADGEGTHWRIDFLEFNTPVSIQPPAPPSK
jgi:predicted small lipoprotein YifL